MKTLILSLITLSTFSMQVSAASSPATAGTGVSISAAQDEINKRARIAIKGDMIGAVTSSEQDDIIKYLYEMENTITRLGSTLDLKAEYRKNMLDFAKIKPGPTSRISQILEERLREAEKEVEANWKAFSHWKAFSLVRAELSRDERESLKRRDYSRTPDDHTDSSEK